MNSPTFISEGSYRFSFKFIIPDKCLPTSFEGRHGNIRYWARAVIERGLGKKNIKTKPAQFLIGDYVALEDFEDVSVSRSWCWKLMYYKRPVDSKIISGSSPGKLKKFYPYVGL